MRNEEDSRWKKSVLGMFSSLVLVLNCSDTMQRRLILSEKTYFINLVNPIALLPMKNFNKPLKIASVLLATSLVAACGGGGSSTPVAETVVTRAYTLFVNTGATSTASATVTGTGATEVLAFTAPAFTLTGATTSNPTWSPNGGQVRSNGNALVYCSAGIGTQSTATAAIREGARVLLSSATSVTDISELRGKTYEYYNCAGVVATLTINADGTSTLNRDGNTINFPESSAASAFSSAGLTAADGFNSKFSAYKITASGVTRYFVVEAGTDVPPTSSRTVALYSQI
jgi:hypothetical protein